MGRRAVRARTRSCDRRKGSADHGKDHGRCGARRKARCIALHRTPATSHRTTGDALPHTGRGCGSRRGDRSSLSSPRVSRRLRRTSDRGDFRTAFDAGRFVARPRRGCGHACRSLRQPSLWASEDPRRTANSAAAPRRSECSRSALARVRVSRRPCIHGTSRRPGSSRELASAVLVASDKGSGGRSPLAARSPAYRGCSLDRGRRHTEGDRNESRSPAPPIGRASERRA